MRKLLALVLALVMTLGLATVGTNAATTFKDDELVSASKYAEAIQVLNGMKVFVGDENGNFNPTQKITRASVAAIIYRIATGDVENKKVENYVNLATQAFSDVNEAKWAAGYIGYCYNAGYIKGYNGKFYPNMDVTGYDTIAMILRAVGYDKNHEFEGDGYQVRVAAQATKLGMLANVAAEDLKLAANREAVARILFDAIRVPQVTWTPALEYNQYNAINANVNDKTNLNPSLGWEHFQLAYNADALADEWGRPSYVWFGDTSGTADTERKADGTYRATYNSKDTIYYKDVREPDAEYNTVAKGCDILDDLSKTSLTIKDAERYINGVNNIKTTAKAATTTTTVPDTTANWSGAAGDTGVGRIVEFYKLDSGDVREVVIDTYLALVTNSTSELKDANDHVTRNAYLTLRLFDTDTTSTNVGSTIYVKNGENAKGDYVLVNVNESEDEYVTIKGLNVEDIEAVTVLQKADKKTAAQTKIFINDNKHEIDGETYYDAKEFHLDVAQADKAYKMDWFFDQFGNVIGNVDIDRNDYAVLENIYYKGGASGEAVATMRYFDGTTKSVTVRHIDGFETLTNNQLQNQVLNVPVTVDDAGTIVEAVDTPNFGWAGLLDDSVITASDDALGVRYVTGQTATANTFLVPGSAHISVTSTNNAAIFNGAAMYRVWTYDDGTVDLEAVENAANARVDTLTAAEITVNYAHNVTIQPNTTAITKNNVPVNGLAGPYLDNNTKFVYRTGTGLTSTYATYTGTANLPAMPINGQANFDSADVFYVVGTNNVATYVYVKFFNGSNLNEGHVFIPYDNSIAVTNAGSGNWVMTNAIKDGEVFALTGTETQIKDLAANKGKLFHVWFNAANAAVRPGQIAAYELVNDWTDGANAAGHGLLTWLTDTKACDYLAADDPTTHELLLRYSNGTLYNGGDRNDLADESGLSYNINEARGTKFFGKVSSQAEFEALFENGRLVSKTLGIWVVFNNNAADLLTNGTYKLASAVYVGERLGYDSGVSVTGYDYLTDAAKRLATNNPSAKKAVNVTSATVAVTAAVDEAAHPYYARTINVTGNAGETGSFMAYETTDALASIRTTSFTADDGTLYAIMRTNGNVLTGYTTTNDPIVNSIEADEAAERVTTGDGLDRFTVWAEDGYHNTRYTVNFKFNTVLQNVKVGDGATVAAAQAAMVNTELYAPLNAEVTDAMLEQLARLAPTATDAQKEIAMRTAITNAVAKGIAFTPTQTGNAIAVSVTGRTGVTVRTTTAGMTAAGQIDAAITSFKTDTLTGTAVAAGNTTRNGGIIVSELTAPSGEVYYLAFTVRTQAAQDDLDALAQQYIDELTALREDIDNNLAAADFANEASKQAALDKLDQAIADLTAEPKKGNASADSIKAIYDDVMAEDEVEEAVELLNKQDTGDILGAITMDDFTENGVAATNYKTNVLKTSDGLVYFKGERPTDEQIENYVGTGTNITRANTIKATDDPADAVNGELDTLFVPAGEEVYIDEAITIKNLIVEGQLYITSGTTKVTKIVVVTKTGDIYGGANAEVPDFSGATTYVDGNSLHFANGAKLGETYLTGTLDVSDGTLTVSKAIESDGTIKVTDTATATFEKTVKSNGALELDGKGTTTFKEAVEFGAKSSVAISGAPTVTFDKTVKNEGEISITSEAAAKETATVTFTGAVTNDGAITVAGAAAEDAKDATTPAVTFNSTIKASDATKQKDSSVTFANATVTLKDAVETGTIALESTTVVGDAKAKITATEAADLKGEVVLGNNSTLDTTKVAEDKITTDDDTAIVEATVDTKTGKVTEVNTVTVPEDATVNVYSIDDDATFVNLVLKKGATVEGSVNVTDTLTVETSATITGDLTATKAVAFERAKDAKDTDVPTLTVGGKTEVKTTVNVSKVEEKSGVYTVNADTEAVVYTGAKKVVTAKVSGLATALGEGKFFVKDAADKWVEVTNDLTVSVASIETLTVVKAKDETAAAEVAVKDQISLKVALTYKAYEAPKA